MNDLHLVDRVAAELVARHGRAALHLLLEHEFAARLLGDDLSADAWFDIALAASHRLNGDQR